MEVTIWVVVMIGILAVLVVAGGQENDDPFAKSEKDWQEYFGISREGHKSKTIKLANKEKTVDFEEYKKAALRTKPKHDFSVGENVYRNTTDFHAVLGIATEASEIVDLFKKELFYNKKIKREDLVEEIGDLLWYLTILIDEWNIDMGEAMLANIRKLERRYPDGFSQDRAVNRGGENE